MSCAVQLKVWDAVEKNLLGCNSGVVNICFREAASRFFVNKWLCLFTMKQSATSLRLFPFVCFRSFVSQLGLGLRAAGRRRMLQSTLACWLHLAILGFRAATSAPIDQQHPPHMSVKCGTICGSWETPVSAPVSAASNL